ncbi:MAG: helix-turn-helix domain-containing protein, partial [Candidatus Hydrogenedentota bacterium]
RGLIGAAKIKTITVEAIQRAVAEHFDVRISDLRGRSRERQVAYPRQIAMYLTRQLIPSLSLKEIGQAFGDKHHTTVLYACQQVTEELARDDAVRVLLQQLEKAIRS